MKRVGEGEKMRNKQWKLKREKKENEVKNSFLWFF